MNIAVAKRTWRPLWTFNTLLGIVGLFLVSCVAAPQLLAFPYVEQIGTTRVYAEQPIDRAAMARILARADARLKTSPLYETPVGTRVFLTNGGWRWRVLALTEAKTLGFTRPVSDYVSDALILNRSDMMRDLLFTRANSRGGRTLSSVIAHERTHIMVRHHLGLAGGIGLPSWISEGYADHVSGESTLSDADAARYRARGKEAVPLFYYNARRRVEAALKANGGDVDALLTMR